MTNGLIPALLLVWEKSGHVFTQKLDGHPSTAVADEECLLEFLFSGRVIYGLTIAAFTWTHYITHTEIYGSYFFWFHIWLNEVRVVIKRVGLNTLGKREIGARNGIVASMIITQ